MKMVSIANREAALSSLDEARATELSDMFKMMADPTRLRIIIACLDMPLAVGAIADKLSLSQSLVSHHLRLLRATRILRGERHGKQVFYTTADDHIRTVITDMMEHVSEPRTESEGFQDG